MRSRNRNAAGELPAAVANDVFGPKQAVWSDGWVYKGLTSWAKMQDTRGRFRYGPTVRQHRRDADFRPHQRPSEIGTGASRAPISSTASAWLHNLRTFAVFSLVLLATVAGGAERGENFFPLMAWDDVEDEATIRKMAECGVNLIAFVPPRLLDACKKHHIKAIVFDQRVTPKWDQPFDSKRANAVLPELIKKYNRHPAVYGYHLKDEPDGNQLSELGRSTELVRKLAPGKWPYINLPPGMGDWYATNYLQLFVDTCKPPAISYDNYAIGEAVDFSYGFWANILDVRSAALRNNLPFHTIILTAAHFNYREPSAADLRLQIYGSLVYGAKGIAFYKFRSRPLAVLGAPDLGNFRLAPLDEFDEKTATWDTLRTINHQIRNLAAVLLKLRSDDVYHVGEVPERNHGILETNLISGLEAGEQFILGEFTHEDGSRWMMVVNKHLKMSTFCRPKFRKAPKKIEYLSPITGKIEPFPHPWYALAPGQGVLLRLTWSGATGSN